MDGRNLLEVRPKRRFGSQERDLEPAVNLKYRGN